MLLQIFSINGRINLDVLFWSKSTKKVRYYDKFVSSNGVPSLAFARQVGSVNRGMKVIEVC